MKGIMIAVAVLFGASMFYGLGYRGLKGDFGGQGKSDVLAKVNGKEIDPLRFREIMNRVVQGFGQNLTVQDLPFVSNLALGQAIDFTLLLGEANKKVRVSGREVDSAIEGIMRQQRVSNKKDLENALKRAGIDYGKFRDLIRDEIAVQKLSMRLREEVKVTPDDLREVKASHILLSTEAEAKLILDKVKGGEDFAALAKQYSLDAISAAKGGDVGYFSTGSMVEPFEAAAFSLKKGETSGIVKSQFGYHIIRVADSRLRKFPGPEKDIEKVALQEKQENTFKRWYANIRNNAKIEIISPELKANDYRFKGRLAEAVAEYNKAVKLTPMNPFLHIYLGDTYFALRQKDLAINEYETAVKMQGGNPEFYLVLGKAYESLGEKGLAADQYKKASMVAGDNKPFHERLLKLFEAMKRPAEVAMEKKEISRIDKKINFEKQLNGSK